MQPLVLAMSAVVIALMAQSGPISSSVTGSAVSGASNPVTTSSREKTTSLVSPVTGSGGSRASTPIRPVTRSGGSSASRPVTASSPVGPVAPSGAGTGWPNLGDVAPSTGFGWPLKPRPTVIRRFEQPNSQWSPGHRGVDLLASVGQPVLSAGDGVVAFSGVIAGRGVVSVRHAGDLRTTYEPVEERLAVGTRVQRGDRIGVLSPMPGHCPPRTCLHWGAISAQVYRDPLSLLGLGRPILLPLG